MLYNIENLNLPRLFIYKILMHTKICVGFLTTKLGLACLKREVSLYYYTVINLYSMRCSGQYILEWVKINVINSTALSNIIIN